MKPIRYSILPALWTIVFLEGCQPGSECPGAIHSWTDTLGQHREERRLELQWLGVSGSRDSLLNTATGRDRIQEAGSSLRADASAYRDSLVAKNGMVLPASVCIDLRGSLEEGRLDRGAFLTALLGRLVDSTAEAVEWTRIDSLSEATSYSVLYSVPGPDGGRLDSTRLRIAKGSVSR